MDIIKGVFRVFIYVTAGITFCTATFLSLFRAEALLHYYLLWQIICMAAVCSLGNLIYISGKELSKRHMKFRQIAHFLYINGIVFGGAYLFEWIHPGLYKEWLLMFSLIIAVYVTVSYTVFRREDKIARDINLRLRKYRKSEEE